MREIKFRAWDKYCNEMLIDVQNEYDSRMTSFRQALNEEYYALMQYTGLKDKNGHEIYEGDIVKQSFAVNIDEYEHCDGYSIYGNDVGKVVIIPSKGVCIKNILRNAIENEEYEIVNQKIKGYKNVVSYSCEVVGNIYENPDLLKESE